MTSITLLLLLYNLQSIRNPQPWMNFIDRPHAVNACRKALRRWFLIFVWIGPCKESTWSRGARCRPRVPPKFWQPRAHNGPARRLRPRPRFLVIVCCERTRSAHSHANRLLCAATGAICIVFIMCRAVVSPRSYFRTRRISLPRYVLALLTRWSIIRVLWVSFGFEFRFRWELLAGKDSSMDHRSVDHQGLSGFIRVLVYTPVTPDCVLTPDRCTISYNY